MKITIFAALIALAVLTAACSEEPSVRTYCDSEMGYTIRKSQDNASYRLGLHIGPKRTMSCWPSADRRANLEADVKSVDEALTLVEQHRARALATQQAVR
jgi:hypothetical protein